MRRLNFFSGIGLMAILNTAAADSWYNHDFKFTINGGTSQIIFLSYNSSNDKLLGDMKSNNEFHIYEPYADDMKPYGIQHFGTVTIGIENTPATCVLDFTVGEGSSGPVAQVTKDSCTGGLQFNDNNYSAGGGSWPSSANYDLHVTQPNKP